jgi:hypothetical protein
VNDPSQLPSGGAGDFRTGGRSLEPAFDQHARMQPTVHDPAGAAATMLAVCDDHGLPIRRATYSPPA